MQKKPLLYLAILFAALLAIIFTKRTLFTDDKVIIDDTIVVDEKINTEISKKENNIEEASVTVENEADISKKQNSKIPSSVLIDVPFTSQAPYAVWDEYHEEACEEASLIMIQYYLEEKNLNQALAEKEIQDIIKFQLEKYGDYKDSNAEEIIKLASDFYSIENLKVIYDFNKSDIKKELAKGNPVIVPAAGRLLGNPFFTPPGPLYHNLVLIGYEGDTIITNDPGTKRGRGYEYNINVLYDSIHDFTGKKADIEKGRKAMIVIEE